MIPILSTLVEADIWDEAFLIEPLADLNEMSWSFEGAPQLEKVLFFMYSYTFDRTIFEVFSPNNNLVKIIWFKYRLQSDLTEGSRSLLRGIFSEIDLDKDMVDKGCSISDICWHIGVQLESSSSSLWSSFESSSYKSSRLAILL